MAECPRCKEQLNGDEKFCPNCKKVILPAVQTASVGVKLTNCPVCKLGIYPAKMGTFDILHCAECGGTAYKKEVLMKMQAADVKTIGIGDLERDHRTPPFFEKRDKPPFLICPFCGKKMAAKKLGPMMTDMCSECSALFMESGKEKHLNDILGSYKMSVMNASRDGGGRHRR
jgi:Zn-finger nucleic acid-binding protein